MLAALRPFYVYLAIAGAALVFTAGWKVRDWQCAAASAAALKAASKETARLQGIVDEKARSYEELRAVLDANVDTRTNTIREIFRAVPAPPAVCEPPPALRGVLASAVADANAAASGQSVEPVPSAPGASRPSD